MRINPNANASMQSAQMEVMIQSRELRDPDASTPVNEWSRRAMPQAFRPIFWTAARL